MLTPYKDRGKSKHITFLTQSSEYDEYEQNITGSEQAHSESIIERTDNCEEDISGKINIIKTAVKILTGTEKLVDELEACFIEQELQNMSLYECQLKLIIINEDIL
jgi:hypothetical protein